MAIINLPTRPERCKDLIATTLGNMDQHIRLLRCATVSAELGNGNDILEVLYFLHEQLRGDCDELFALLS